VITERHVTDDLLTLPLNLTSANNQFISRLRAGASELLFAANSPDQVVSVCVLDDVNELTTVLSQVWALLKPEGNFFKFLPLESGCL
jgi:ubiquinone/menaquinone biosynthesis C-methylase UbiE